MNRLFNNSFLLIILSVLVTYLFSACTTISTESDSMENLEGLQMTQIELTIRLNEFDKYFNGRVEEAADKIIQSTDSKEIKINALQWKINVIPRAMESLVIPDPRAAGVDLYALSGQMLEFFSTGKGKNLFGDYQYIAIEASEDIMHEVMKIANDFRDIRYRQETTKIVEDWIKENPIQNIQFNRRSTFELLAKTLGAEEYTLGSSVGDIAQGVQDIRRQITSYTEFLPKHIKWRAQLASYEMFGDSVVQKTFSNFDRMVNSTERITRVAEETPSLIMDIQQSSFAEINRQLLLTLTTLAHERTILIDEMRKERIEVLKDINQQRFESLDHVEKLAETSINQSSIIADDIIDKMFFRSLILLMIIFVGGIVTLKLFRKGK
ncbi:MAG TPA: hypothetical protein VIZ21_06095 [Ignavibacteriaceae bacterium]